MDASTIRKLSDLISQRNVIHDKSSSISNIQIKESYPLSYAQRRIYYATKMIGKDSIAYNTPGALLIDGLLDSKKVEQVFIKIINTQSSFRTIFVRDGEEIKQKILNSVNFSIDISYDTEKNVNKIIQRFPKPFDLEMAPLLRVTLCYLDNKKTLLLVDSHHIIMDGVSIEILIKNFFSIYNDFPMSKSPIEYKDYAVYEKEFLNSDDIKNLKNTG